ncbi:MAG: T9SS type A sorting domain-containing protein [Bacteroidales bacterium]|nr:T9SS type A sorting domain-containing protein [Bacteroidales bacterium]
MKKMYIILLKDLQVLLYVTGFIFFAEAQTDLVGHWAMEESDVATTLTDSSTFANDGTVTGSLVQELGQRGYGQVFDGSNDYVLVPDDASLDITDEITLAVWIKPAKIGTQRIIRKVNTSGAGYSLFLSASGYFSIKFNHSDAIRVNTSELYNSYINQWIHIAATYDGTTIKTYINGDPDNTKTISFTIGTNDKKLCLGAKAEDGGNKYEGVMDDARVYNYALSPTEISSLLTTWAPPIPDNLVGHWKMEEGSGSVLVDSSSYINNGTITGAPAWVTGKDDLALDLDGSNDYATVPDDVSLDITGEITLAAWIRPEIAGTQRIIRKVDATANTGYSLFLSANGYVSIRFNDNNTYRVNTNAFYPTSGTEWMHVAATYDGEKIKTYINGETDASIPVSFAISPNNENLSIGATTGGVDKLQGAIDDVRVYNIALSLEEIRALPGFDLLPEFEYAPGFDLDFDGSNDYAQVPDDASLDITNSITIEAWIKPDVEGTQYVVKKAIQDNTDGYELSLSSPTSGAGPKKFFFRLNQATSSNDYRLNSATDYQTGVWTHVAATYDGSTMRIFLNGVEDNTLPTPTPVVIYSNSLNLGIGAQSDGGSVFNGKLDEIRLWNTARTVTQIRDNMYCVLPNPVSETNLVAYYQLNEGSEQSIVDASSYGNHGFLGDNPGIDSDDPTWVPSTAPIPFYSIQDGNWNENSTWATGQLAPAKDWSRVTINNLINENINETVEKTIINPPGALTVNSGNTLTINGDLTILSDLTGTGSFIDYGTITIAGTTVVEQYITSERWHYVSPPISDGEAGIFYDIYLIEFDEPTGTFSYITGIGADLNPMQGYGAWAGDSYTGTTTVYYEGTLNTGSLNSGVLTNTSAATHSHKGFNFVGNPYPSAVNWDEGAGWAKTNLDNAIYIWNPEYGNYGSYIGGVPVNDVTNIIPVGQGFFVHVTNGFATGSLAVNNNARLHDNKPFLKNSGKSTKTGQELLKLQISTELNTYLDQAIVHFNENATANFDPSLDAYDLEGLDEAPGLYFPLAGNTKLSINTYPELDENTVMPLNSIVGIDGYYTIEAISILNFLETTKVLLEDKVEDVIIDLTEQNSYTFFAGEIDDPARFNLHFKVSNMGIDDQTTEDINIYSVEDIIYIRTPEMESGEVCIIDMLGQKIVRKQSGESNLTKIRITSGTGYYLVKYQSDKILVTKKVFIK